MGSGASSATPCLAGFFALRCFSLITIWVTPESWAVKLITSLPHWFYTRILRVPKCFPAVGPSLDANSLHNSGDTIEKGPRLRAIPAQGSAQLPRHDRARVRLQVESLYILCCRTTAPPMRVQDLSFADSNFPKVPIEFESSRRVNGS